MDHPSKTVEIDNSQIEQGDNIGQLSADERKSNAADRRDMVRMGKPQEMKVRTQATSVCLAIVLVLIRIQRNFRSITMFGFSVILMASWEGILRSVAS